eukprot:scaffold37398_cov48-Phaeocystis_antarctica.AAC.2
MPWPDMPGSLMRRISRCSPGAHHLLGAPAQGENPARVSSRPAWGSSASPGFEPCVAAYVCSASISPSFCCSADRLAAPDPPPPRGDPPPPPPPPSRSICVSLSLSRSSLTDWTSFSCSSCRILAFFSLTTYSTCRGGAEAVAVEEEWRGHRGGTERREGTERMCEGEARECRGRRGGQGGEGGDS